MRLVDGDTAEPDREGALTALLAECAPSMAATAAVLCQGGYVDSESCDWYHGTWPYLRCLGVVSSPAWHREFYGKALRHAIEDARRARPRVLVSGTADFSMVEQLLHVTTMPGSTAAAVDITVLDRCPTPLEACDWYAKRAGIVLDTRAADIFDADPGSEPFDVITSDAFLTRFRRDQCVAVIRAWRRLLSANGTVVTTVRLHGQRETSRDAEADQRDFAERVYRLAEEHESEIFDDSRSIAAGALTYARRMHSTDLGDEEAVVRMFEDNGFEVSWRDRARVSGELHPAEYLRLVAHRC
jgi:hypothetical protein